MPRGKPTTPKARARRPSPNGANGRGPKGRFAKGNPGGPGNPYAKRTADIRAAFTEAVTVDDLQAIVKALVRKAKKGDVIAAREVFDRLVGKATVMIEPTQDGTSQQSGVVIYLPDNGRGDADAVLLPPNQMPKNR